VTFLVVFDFTDIDHDETGIAQVGRQPFCGNDRVEVTAMACGGQQQHQGDKKENRDATFFHFHSFLHEHSRISEIMAGLPFRFTCQAGFGLAAFSAVKIACKVPVVNFHHPKAAMKHNEKAGKGYGQSPPPAECWRRSRIWFFFILMP
jgi:hypothetical protein